MRRDNVGIGWHGHDLSLTRQDLEAWALAKVALSDRKFELVHRFLTHPDTLARPEFADAIALKNP
jgi:hypothetical protein